MRQILQVIRGHLKAPKIEKNFWQPSPLDRLSPTPAVRAATHRALAARDHLLQDYPRWEEWRAQARAIKAEAIARLDEFLDRLQQAVTAWGGQVLLARDAAQARELILEVARQHRVKTVVKSKSMTTEEIGLNPALAAAGIQVWETDLGEFIVQLAGHPPAHLTAPALHLNRYQIARLFREHLGSAASLSPEVLTRQATDYLKPWYGEAQMGITGVNFATPDGTLILLENESNLRLTATLPPVHLALMGLEKLIPTLAELEVFLRLLPASATGQRLTALVHFLQGLKPQHPKPQAFYLVILDNGRRRLAAEPELAEALYCLRCGACLNVCPIFQVGAAHLYGRIYPGAIGILLAPYLAPVGDISDLCTQCGACQEICPVQIGLPEKIQGLRRRSPRFRRLRVLSGAAGRLLTHPRLYRRLETGGRRLAGLLPGAATVLAPESFYQLCARRGGGLPGPHLRRPAFGQAGVFPGAAGARPSSTPSLSRDETPAFPPGTDPYLRLAARLAEVGGSLHRARGPAALARLLASFAPVWLEDHPWLRQVAVTLEDLGMAAPVLGETRPPETWTALLVGLGAVPETGSVLLESATPAALGLRAPKLVILLPPGGADLTLAQALELTRQRRPGMVSWLTGPSRTADIEKVLVLGAQGQKELAVVLYEGEG